MSLPNYGVLEVREALYTKAAETFGIHSQCVVTLEELGELTAVLAQWLNGKSKMDDVAGEIADVEIMIEQLKMNFNVREEVVRIKWDKLRRLEARLSRPGPPSHAKLEEG